MTREHTERGNSKFPKNERLTGKKTIDELFEKGSSAYLYPFRILYSGSLSGHSGFPCVLFSVPKKNFKRAVDRNRIRRQMRESYRLHKSRIFSGLENSQIPAFLAILYTSKEKMPYKKLEEKLILILQRFKNIKS